MTRHVRGEHIWGISGGATAIGESGQESGKAGRDVASDVIYAPYFSKVKTIAAESTCSEQFPQATCRGVCLSAFSVCVSIPCRRSTSKTSTFPAATAACSNESPAPECAQQATTNTLLNTHRPTINIALARMSADAGNKRAHLNRLEPSRTVGAGGKKGGSDVSPARQHQHHCAKSIGC